MPSTVHTTYVDGDNPIAWPNFDPYQSGCSGDVFTFEFVYASKVTYSGDPSQDSVPVVSPITQVTVKHLDGTVEGLAFSDYLRRDYNSTTTLVRDIFRYPCQNGDIVQIFCNPPPTPPGNYSVQFKHKKSVDTDICFGWHIAECRNGVICVSEEWMIGGYNGPALPVWVNFRVYKTMTPTECSHAYFRVAEGVSAPPPPL